VGLPYGTVESRVNYIGQMSERPRYHAKDDSRDNLTLDPRVVRIEDARLWTQPPSLSREGFALFPHKSSSLGLRDVQEMARVRALETERLLLDLTGADAVVFGTPAVRRFARISPEEVGLIDSGKLYNTRALRFVHADVSDSAAAMFAKLWLSKIHHRPVRRFAYYNVWRVLSPPPQDAPLALCDSRSVSQSDLVEADAVMDHPGKRETSYAGLVIRYNPRHRWAYFSDMRSDEVIVFKQHDSDPGQPGQVPHSAFHNPACPPGAVPRASVEMRGVALWLGG
jgi:hypothetical protein